MCDSWIEEKMTTLRQPVALLVTVTVTVTVGFLPLARATCLPDQPESGGLAVTYGDTQLDYNDHVTDLSLLSAQPSLSAASLQGDLLLLMVDPDAPSAKNCPDKYWMHWMAEASVQDGKVDIDKTLVEYHPPTPPKGSGPHRYQFLLYSLNGNDPSSEVPSGRSGFDLATFTSDLALGGPVASFQFTAEN